MLRYSNTEKYLLYTALMTFVYLPNIDLDDKTINSRYEAYMCNKFNLKWVL